MKMIVCYLYTLLGVQFPQFPAGGSLSPVFNVFGNSASMASLRQLAAGVYTERRYLLREMSVYAMALHVPVATGALGFKLWQFGFPLYRQQLAGLGYALPLGERLQAGVCLNYWMKGVEGELGVRWKLSKQVAMGLHMWAPGRSTGVYTVSLQYQPSPGLRLDGEWRKEPGWVPVTRVHCIYRPAPALTLLAGFSAAPAAPFAGAAVTTGRLRIAVTGSYHLWLGITPGIALVWGRE